MSKKIDLSIDFLGVHCENPFFLSSSPVCHNYEMIAKCFDCPSSFTSPAPPGNAG